MMDYLGALSGSKNRKDLVEFLENTREWLPHFLLSTCCVLTVQWLLALPGRNKIWNYLSLCIPSFLLACQICLVEQSYWLSLQNIKLSRGTSYHHEDTTQAPTHWEVRKAERLKCTYYCTTANMWLSFTLWISGENLSSCWIIISLLSCRRQRCTDWYHSLFQVK